MTQEPTTAAELAGIRVLALDDEEAIRVFIRTALEKRGAYVRVARNGREGLQILLNDNFDVLVVDLQMQEMSGLAFLQEARKIWPWLGVIIISGHVSDASMAEAASMGVQNILAKPIHIDRLRETVLSEARKTAERMALNTVAKPINEVQNQLAVLRQLGEEALGTESLVEALRCISRGLLKLVPSTILGVFGEEVGNYAMILTATQPVSKRFMETIQTEMLDRYTALSGRKLDPKTVRFQFEGEIREGEPETGTHFSVPIITSDGIQGLMTLGSVVPDAYAHADMSFLYHAANQLSMVLVALAHMRHLAVRDPLTGLFNRRQLESEVDHIWKLSERHDHDFSIALLDIDDFKTYNDTHGHQAGDQIIREFADLLRKTARTTDHVGRYGGDEFLLLFPQTSGENTKLFGDRLIAAMANYRFCAGKLDLEVRTSIGIAERKSVDPPRSLDDMLRQADSAMYQAKAKGKNQVALWAVHSPETGAPPPPPDETPKPKLPAGTRPPRRAASPPPRPPAAAPAPAAPEPPPPAMVLAPSTPVSGEPRNPRVLLVDDEASVGRLLQVLLERRNYELVVCGSVTQGIETLRANPGRFDLTLTDIELTGESGLDFLQEVKNHPETLVHIVITGNPTADNVLAAMRHGAYDFIPKPFVREQLFAILDRALEYRRLLVENRNYPKRLEEMVDRKSTELKQALQEVRESYDFTLEALANLLDARERKTGHHSYRVRSMSLILARELQVSGRELEEIGRGALLHDLGKIATPDSVLLKEGALTPEERKQMEHHIEVGYNILRSCPPMAAAAEILRSHHEQFDGSGYPRGLKGKEICLGARIFAVVDAYDAMRSNRPYREGMTTEEVLAELRRCSGTQFDPEVVDACLRCYREFEEVCDWSKDEPPRF